MNTDNKDLRTIHIGKDLHTQQKLEALQMDISLKELVELKLARPLKAVKVPRVTKEQLTR